jgi:PAS domain S-box-containing protein
MSAVPAHAPSDAPAVLLVDDRRENLLALEAVLAPLACRCVTASSGEEALRRLLLEDFAVILLDVQMPDLDGFETAEFIKRRERTQAVPIIFVTAISKEPEHVFRGYRAGAVDYVFKPYVPEVLRSKVAVFLQLHEATRALAASEAVLRATFDAAPIGMARVDPDGRIDDVNRRLAATLGRSPAELCDRLFDSLVHRDDAGTDAIPRRALLAGRLSGYETELRLVGPDGEAVPCLCSFSLAAGTDGRADSVVAQVQDLRERKKAETEREELVREHAARAEAERVTRRLQAVQRLTDAALASPDLDELLRELLERIVEVLGVDAAAVLLHDDEGHATVFQVAGGVAVVREERWLLPGTGFAARVASEGAPVAVEDAGAEDADAHPLGTSVTSLLGVALRTRDRVVGALHVGSLFARRFAEEDAAILALAGERAALAIERARLFERERTIAQQLQRSLLPAELPRLPGIAAAARYQPGGAGTEVGGDWYDAIAVPDGRLLLVMGDVAGRGVAAASMMGQLRSAIRAYAVDERSPAELLGRLNGFLLGLAAETMATVAVVEVDVAAGTLRVASAGHPPALLVGADGTARWLRPGRGVPLGAHDAPHLEEATEPLEPGATLVLYTDGLVEQRGEDLDLGMQRLRDAVLDGPEGLDALCDHVLARAGADGSDDVTLLVLRTLSTAADHVVLEMPGDAPALAALRATLRRWLGASAASPEEITDITMATNEAVQNAIEHAHALTPRPFSVELQRDDGSVTVVVRDRGAWREGLSHNRGRGLSLMRALMTDVEIVPSEDGTAVTLHRELLSAAPRSPRSPPAHRSPPPR